MPFSRSQQGLLPVLLALAITQLIGWGTIGMLAIVGRDVGADLGMDLATVFAGTSTLHVVMGLSARALAKPFVVYGARRVMMAGSLIAAPGFLLIASAQNPAIYFLGWAVLGVACSAMLSTACYIMINEVAGAKSGRAIGALMLVTGLSSSLFWPTTSLLAHAFGWRTTCLIYAAVMVGISFPLHALVLPRKARAGDFVVAGGRPAAPRPLAPRGTFPMLAASLALNAFVQFGLGAVFIELLRAQGLDTPTAVAFGSALGIVQIGARALDFLGGGRWDGLSTGIIAGAALPAAMLLLLAGGGTLWSIVVFILLYGLGSGALAVARATIPLVFYDQDEFARATARIALPTSLMSAMAPPVLASTLTSFGSHGVLWVTTACACGSLAFLLLLGRRRPA